MRVDVRNLNKSFGDFQASSDISFTIEGGKLVGLLGPSGSGKTTILRMLAGLETPDSGDILFEGESVLGLPPQKRGIGFVFQNYALFRHMTIFENIAFGLRVNKWSKPQIHSRVTELLELTGLQGLAKRYPHQLSGGQRQRVAFARALAPQPKLLLLDEPFAAIDAKVRKELRSWLRETINRLGITTVFVTHDQEEAVEVADEILVLHQGCLQQQGTPIDIYKSPATPFVAGFIGESAIIENPAELRGFSQASSGSQAVIRPEFLEIGTEREIEPISAAERGLVTGVWFRGNRWQIEVEVPDDVASGRRRLTGYRSLEQPELSPGQEVLVLIHRLYLFQGDRTETVENALKSDRMPVHI
ncbi:sulfate/molybdate ABC transporter ATP-binding protein [Paenibacillus thermoaerophilus]|uniref:Sulfate/molybdate ABC transporter ATP-binding protein n=1 Tax=Paenibacillus thermoaerophilus TaxID=1215385 RepID=A0ABW2UZA7_9BACL|nr:sulfate ABC transporter ATP-binding protein [Paenibacillus thermoaerophilus]TMV19013.1 sulfate ABC transporter ATP-binding protein [Paenibacillus thermoaerophilus]